NHRFFDDVQSWLGVPIKILRSEKYSDIYDVFERTRFLKGPHGARCTTELKKSVRHAYQEADDIHALGYTVDEPGRVAQFKRENPEVVTDFPLVRHGIDKRETLRRLVAAKIELPAMYALGYKNNNCIGCVKGGIGYWNKIRQDFPDAFNRMAAMERKLDHALLRQETGTRGTEGHRAEAVFLDELPPNIGRYEAEPDIECGVMCSPGTPVQGLLFPEATSRLQQDFPEVVRTA